MTKYQIKSNLSEKQIEADVASYFGWCSESTPFRLLDTDELKTGADKEYKSICGGLIYIQFKKSEGLRAVSEIQLSNRINRSKLEDIRKFRYDNRLDDNPTLYFKLRDKAKTASDFQHNILKNHHAPPNAYAIYVAPLILDKNEYYNALFNSCHLYDRYLLDPFNWRMIDNYGIQVIQHIPFLKNHVSIIPHEIVTNSNHYYAYSQTGTDISWHSPSILEYEPRRLSDFIYKLFSDKQNEEMSSIANIAMNIIDILEGTKSEFNFKNYKENPILLIKKYGEWLKTNYSIKQFIIIKNE
ncbi:hypothetical protein [Aggregatibacter kilianii]|uniref:hypothetical protein n=1 Tax=Aggregatibacter kilianii TaxID=2025884 RepID=UPI0028D36573|nr:hypothetical protein [Aggregatibacter kilianii]